MGTSKDDAIMYECQQTKDAVNRYKQDFLDFVCKSLNDEKVIRKTKALLPFDNFVSSRLHIVDDNQLVKSMGFSIMRMEVEPATFSLGISIEIGVGTYNNKSNTTLFIAAFKTMEQLGEYVKNEPFSSTVSEYFEEEIEKSFYSQ